MGESLVAAMIVRACAPRSKRAFADWAKATYLPDLMHFTSADLTSQHFWDQMHAVPVEKLAVIEQELVQEVVRIEQLHLQALAYDTTNFYTHIASTNLRPKLPQRGKNKQGRHDLRQMGLALLPPSDYEVTFDELRASILANGPDDGRASWDAAWRLRLILNDNLEILSRLLWHVGVPRDFRADGSFAEDKDHPNDIDGYFECSLDAIRTGELTHGNSTASTPSRSGLGTRRRGGHSVVIRRSSYQCGIAAGSNSIRTFQDSGWGGAFETSSATSWSFLPPSGDRVGMATERHREDQVWRRTSMIRNEAEYQEASARLADERTRLAEHRIRLKEAGLKDDEIKRVIDPMESFHLQLQEEVASYERLKRGEFDDLENLRGLGHLLISVRIAQGIAQRELAKRLGVHESQVSRDERNEYFGITLERAVKVLDALNVKLHTKVEMASSTQELAIA